MLVLIGLKNERETPMDNGLALQILFDNKTKY